MAKKQTKQKQSFVTRLDAWHQTREGLLVFALIELLLAYAFASLAIDTGSLLVYAVTIIVAIGGFRNLVLFVKKVVLKK